LDSRYEVHHPIATVWKKDKPHPGFEAILRNLQARRLIEHACVARLHGQLEERTLRFDNFDGFEGLGK